MRFIYLGSVRNKHFLSLKYCTATSICLCLSICQTGTDNLPLDCTFFQFVMLFTGNWRSVWEPTTATADRRPRSLPQKQREVWCDCIPKIKPSTNRMPGSSSVHNPAFTCSWYEGGMKVRRYQTLYCPVLIEATAGERQ